MNSKLFVEQFDCIAKPVGSSLGRGVFLIERAGGEFRII